MPSFLPFRSERVWSGESCGKMLSPASLHLMIAEQEVDVGFGGFTTMAIARARGKNVIAVHGIFSPVNLVFVTWALTPAPACDARERSLRS